MAFSALGAALLGGSALMSGISQRDANARERRRFRRMVRRRRESPEGQQLQGAISELGRLAGTLPGQIRSNLRGQAVAQQQANLAKLNRSLAQRGMTAGSGVYGRAQRGAVGDLIRQQQNIETSTGRLGADLQSKLGNLSLRAGQYFNPMAMGPEEQYINPMDIVTQAGIGGILGGRMFGGAQGGIDWANTPSGASDFGFNPASGLYEGL